MIKVTKIPTLMVINSPRLSKFVAENNIAVEEGNCLNTSGLYLEFARERSKHNCGLPVNKSTYFFAYTGKTILGYSYLKFVTHWGSDEYQCGFYVLPEHRRKGVGSMIAQRIKQHVGTNKCIAESWNDSSESFFAKTKIEEGHWKWTE